MQEQPGNPSALEDTLIPIVIGVTGHRDLRSEDIMALKDLVKTILISIRSKYPHSPIELISPLAEGADRLVARVASELAIDVLVPLPLPISDYEASFANQESREEFRELIQQSKLQWEVRSRPVGSRRDTSSLDEDREHMYTAAGVYVAQNSQILIALWDGVESGSSAGTAAIVRYKLHGTPEAHLGTASSLIQSESGPVYHIVTPRISNPTPTGVILSTVELYPEYWGQISQARKAYRLLLGNIEAYNLDSRRLVKLIRIRRDESLSALALKCSTKDGSLALRKLAFRFAVSDAMASHFKTRRLWTLRAVFVLVVLGFMAFQLYLEFGRSSSLLLLYPTMLCLALGLYFYSRRGEFERKHEDYRGLAEAVRVQFFWKLAGINANVADHFLRRQKGELEWIKYTLRVWSIINDATNRSVLTAVSVVSVNWIDDQAAWFKCHAVKNKKIHSHSQTAARTLFVIGLSLALLLYFIKILAPRDLEHSTASFQSYVILATVMSLALAAAIQGYLEKLVLSEQSRQYRNMADLFGLAQKKIRLAIQRDDNSEVAGILYDLGMEALSENGNWVLLHRARSLEVPIM